MTNFGKESAMLYVRRRVVYIAEQDHAPRKALYIHSHHHHKSCNIFSTQRVLCGMLVQTSRLFLLYTAQQS